MKWKSNIANLRVYQGEYWELYCMQTGRIPSVLEIKNLEDTNKLLDAIRRRFDFAEDQIIISNHHSPKTGKLENYSVYIQLEDQLAIHLSCILNEAYIYHENQDSKSYQDLYQLCLSNIKAAKKKLYFVSEYNYELHLRSNPADYHFDEKFFQHYNVDFEAFDTTVRERLENEHQGILLLHGLPGTGKTTYIKYLIANVSKRFIYINAKQSSFFDDPKFIEFIQQFPNSVLIIEDAEEILKERNLYGENFVSNLLNIGDGLLGDCLRLQVICTFNSQITDIDPALLRNGRLIGRYEFTELTPDRVQLIAPEITEKRKMTLSDLMSKKAVSSVKPKRVIGFK